MRTKRRSVSIRKRMYDLLSVYCTERGVSKAQVVETEIAKLLGVPPPKGFRTTVRAPFAGGSTEPALLPTAEAIDPIKEDPPVRLRFRSQHPSPEPPPPTAADIFTF